LIYYLDGYNYLFLSGKKEDPLELSRGEVLDEFSLKVKHLDLIVVFDSHKDQGELSRTYYKNIEVVYTTHNQTADDFILERIALSKTPYKISVISNDKKLLKEAQNLKAHTYSFESFLKKINKKRNGFNEKRGSASFGSSEQDYYLKKFEE
jgi:uncharacterized protein